MSRLSNIGVVLLNWNTPDLTLACLDSLARSTVRPWRIVVIDNASSGDDVEQITVAYPDVHLIRNDDNRGYAEGNNQGFERLLDAGADAVWVLNNDTEVAPDCLEKLIDVLAKSEGRGRDGANALLRVSGPAMVRGRTDFLVELRGHPRGDEPNRRGVQGSGARRGFRDGV